ncbi:MFS transporter [Haloarchaeobius amylolyticus]|uniref:MFS transporter n=1 Tax=Haloarchaeobius amylolyticus TaxID=1198296 RepID=UPI002270708B|nr:MFS transporter [Haloarchaeobius amylolyticus]
MAATHAQNEVPGPAEVPRKRAMAVVVLVVFLDLVGFGIVIPILPFYVRSFAVSDVFIGLLAASYSIMQFLAAPWLGRLSDQRGRRPVLVLSLLGSVAAWIVFGLAGALWVLFLARMLAGAMGGNIATAQAYVADVTPPAERAKALGILGASFALGFIFGPALGGFFASDPVLAVARDVLPAAVPVTQFSIPSFAAAGMSLLGVVVALAFLPEPDRLRTAGERETLVGQFRNALADPDLRGLVLSFFLVSVAFSGVTIAFIPWLADTFGYESEQAALFMTYVGVLGVVVQAGLVGTVSKRLGDERMAVLGGAALAVAVTLIPFAPTLGRLLPSLGPLPAGALAVVLVLPLLSFGNGLLNAALGALVSKSASAETQGSAFGVTQGAGSLGRTVGPPAMAGLYAFAFHWVPFVVGGLLLVPVLGLLLAFVRE